MKNQHYIYLNSIILNCHRNQSKVSYGWSGKKPSPKMILQLLFWDSLNLINHQHCWTWSDKRNEERRIYDRLSNIQISTIVKELIQQ